MSRYPEPSTIRTSGPRGILGLKPVLGGIALAGGATERRSSLADVRDAGTDIR